ncbi:hypothetical protein [Nannocystis radixulma]|uniref:Uncharacterized protein n=1 Tax=Nannocystis radixulma TaxID=2995305 RepID=A0ABT5BNN4_9BACT|nr:hypothetical protein [Nannocystis radixulma]MDC0675702.1 hypothetical protein [Nannocystis radixulma]
MVRRLGLFTLLLSCAPPTGGGTGTSDNETESTSSGDVVPTSGTTDNIGDTSSGSSTDEGSSSGEPAEPYVPLDGNAFPWAGESTDELCDDGDDNDDNSYADCEDFSCSRNQSVFVCEGDSIYESTPELCDDNLDDDGDKLTDCADPDCFKNPFHAVCDKPRVETDCQGGGDGDGDGLTGCDDSDCALDVAACPPAAGSLRVLFDQTLDETAGAGPNSDWVVDRWGRVPAPSDPDSADEWHGALSGFGFGLHQQGHRVENLVPWDGRLSHGDPDNPQDLTHYDVLVLVEPSRRIRSEERAAIVEFVLAGGGLLAVANHNSADRDSNGYSAPGAFNELLDDNGVMTDPFGFRFDEVDRDTPTVLTDIVDPGHPVLDGPGGVVAAIGFYEGCTAHVTGAGAIGLITLGASEELVVGAAEAGDGRVVFITDSAILGDGTDSHGNTLTDHDSWNDPTQDNRALLLNAIAWLGEQG